MIIIKLCLLLLLWVPLLNAQITERDIRQSRSAFAEGVRKGVDNDFAAAHDLFDQAIRLDSLYSEAYLYRGLARIELERFEEALADFGRIITDMNRDIAHQANYFSGVTLLALDRYTEALKRLNEAVKLNPDFSSFFQRGKAFFYLEQYEEALHDFNVSNRLHKGIPEVFFYRGKTHLHKEMYEQALDDLLFAKAGLEGNPEFHYYYGFVLQELGQNEAAASHLAIAEKVFGVPLEPIIRDQNDNNLDQETKSEIIESEDVTDKIEKPEPEKTTPKPNINELSEGFYDINLNPVSPKGMGVQIASYAATDDILSHAAKYQRQFGHPAFIEVAEVNDRIRYRLILGKFESRDDALILRGRLRDQGFLDSFIVRFPR